CGIAENNFRKNPPYRIADTGTAASGKRIPLPAGIFRGRFWGGTVSAEEPKIHSSYASGTGATSLLGCTIGEALDTAARGYSNSLALVSRHQNQRLTFAELSAAVEQFARGLMHLGVQKGDRVGIWATNSSEWVIVQFATAKIGAVLVN